MVNLNVNTIPSWRRNGGVPFKSDLSFYSKTRDDLTLVDTFGNDAEVIGRSIGVGNGISTKIDTNSIPTINTEITIIGNFNTIAADQSMGQYTTNARTDFGVASGKWYAAFGLSGSIFNTITADTLVHKFTYNKNGFYIDDIRIYNFTSLPFTEANTHFFLFSRSSSLYCNFNMQYFSYKENGVILKECYFNDHIINSIDGTNIGTATGLTFAIDKSVSPLDALENGYYELSTGEQIINPQFELPEGATLHEGGKFHNLINSYVRFPALDIFDRSNTTVYNSDARDSIYYDSVNPTDFHISELNQYVLSGYLNVGYRGMPFAKFNTNSIDDRNFMESFMAYATDKTLNNEIKVLKYTGDIAKAIDDGSGSYVVDENGYVILTE